MSRVDFSFQESREPPLACEPRRKNYTEDPRPALQPTCWENNHRPSPTLSFRGHANKFEGDLGHHPPIVAKKLHWHFSSLWRNEEEGLWRHESLEDEFLQYHTTCHALENPNCMGLVYHEALVVHSSGDVFSRMKENSYWVERAWGESTPRARELRSIAQCTHGSCLDRTVGALFSMRSRGQRKKGAPTALLGSFRIPAFIPTENIFSDWTARYSLQFLSASLPSLVILFNGCCLLSHCCPSQQLQLHCYQQQLGCKSLGLRKFCSLRHTLSKLLREIT